MRLSSEEARSEVAFCVQLCMGPENLKASPETLTLEPWRQVATSHTEPGAGTSVQNSSEKVSLVGAFPEDPQCVPVQRPEKQPSRRED